MSAHERCRGDWVLRLLGGTALALVVALIAAVVWKATA